LEMDRMDAALAILSWTNSEGNGKGISINTVDDDGRTGMCEESLLFEWLRERGNSSVDLCKLQHCTTRPRRQGRNFVRPCYRTWKHF